MENINMLLDKINEIGYKEISKQEKHEILSKLWVKVWENLDDQDFPIQEVYNTYLNHENTSFIIDQPPIIKKIDLEKIKETLLNFEKNHYLTQEEAIMLLDWTINNARYSIEKLGIFIMENSLNGYCELGQVLTIMPFEKIGLKVTKNCARECFFYPYNYVFGTVTFPIFADKITMKTYLLDVSYRQFFTTTRCNEGMYNVKGFFDLPTSPAPGYFVEDKEFAKKLMADGYILLTEQNAKKYGEPFYKTSLEKGEISNFSEDYFENILKKTGDYIITDFEDLLLEFPNKKTKMK